NADAIEHVDANHAVEAIPRTEATLEVTSDQVEVADDVRLRGLDPAVSVTNPDLLFVKIHLLNARIRRGKTPKQRLTCLFGKVVDQPRLAEAGWELCQQIGQ